MRALGLDVGSKTIGVALSDALGLCGHPRETLARRGTKLDVEAIVGHIERDGVEAVVVGLPLELSGAAGPRARRVMVLVDALKARLGDRVPVELWDERFSTVAVERILIEGNVSRARRKEVIDKQAAAYILQGWLDARRPGG